MLFIDDRVGSRDLLSPLQRAGLDADLARLPFGDVAFAGRGVGDKPVNVGIELKVVADAIQSLRSERLAGHQVPGMVPMYDYRWLVIEGARRTDRQGQILLRRGQFQWTPVMSLAEFEKRLITLEMVMGLKIRFTQTRYETVRFLCQLYRWWTDTSMDDHRSHIAVHEQPTMIPLSRFRQAVVKWPHIGIRTSLMVEETFGGSIRRAATASVNEWAAIPVAKGGRRLGTKHAQDVVDFVNGRY